MTTAHQKFDFDTVFAADGEVLRDGQRVKKYLTQEEVEAVRREAFKEGQMTEVSQAASAQANAIQAVASQMQLILSRLQNESETLRREAAEMALVTARKLAGDAIDERAAETLSGFCGEIMKDLRGEPQFSVHCAEAVAGEVARALEQVAASTGFDGAINVRANPEIHGADCRLEWGSGTVERSQQAIEARIEALIADWLVAPGEEPSANAEEPVESPSSSFDQGLTG